METAELLEVDELSPGAHTGEVQLNAEHVLGLTDKDAGYVDFWLRMQKAEGEGALGHLENIRDHSGRDWKASQFMLQARHGYTIKQQTEVSGEIGGGTTTIILPSNGRDDD